MTRCCMQYGQVVQVWIADDSVAVTPLPHLGHKWTTPAQPSAHGRSITPGSAGETRISTDRSDSFTSRALPRWPMTQVLPAGQYRCESDDDTA
jgi:BRCT domain type II-containing protein